MMILFFYLLSYLLNVVVEYNRLFLMLLNVFVDEMLMAIELNLLFELVLDHFVLKYNLFVDRSVVDKQIVDHHKFE